ncbi:MAG: ComEC/Rec2 family competence protein [candidate division WOR-3 bacterium]
MRYLALKSLSVIALGIIFTHFFHLSPYYLFVFFILALILSFFTNGYSLFFALFLISALNYQCYQTHCENIKNFQLYNTPIKITGKIIDSPINGRYRYSLKLMTINDKKIFAKAFLYDKSQDKKFAYGDVIECYAPIIDFDFPKNPNLVDYNDYFHKQGYVGNIFINSSEIKIVKSKSANWLKQNIILPLHDYFLNTIDKYFDNDEKDLLLGILLGEKRTMSKNLRTTFANSGLAHILAVSGLHISIIIGVLLLLLPIFRIRGIWQLVILVLLTTLYLALIGFRISAVRAGLMTLFASLGLFLERRYEPINGVFLAGIIILFFTPQALFDIGFQLSFMTTAAILLISPHLYNLIKNKNISRYLKKYLFLPLFVSVSAAIGVIPLLSYYFFEFPLFIVFSNLLIIPLVGLAMPLGFIVLFFNLIWPYLAQIFANTLWLLLKLIILISSKIADFSWQIVEIGRPPLVLILSFYLVVLIIRFWRNVKFRKISLLVLLIMLNIFIGQKVISSKSLKITFLDTNQGDAIFFNLPNKRTMLIDAGFENEIVEQFLKSQGIKQLDLAVITHPHFDHYGGFINLVDNFKIQNLLIPTDKSNDTIYTNLIAKIKGKKSSIIFAESGETIAGLGISAHILSPNKVLKQIYQLNKLDVNDLSIVLKIAYKNTTFLFTGDLSDIELINDLPIKADILKSPHHGSEKANNFLLFNLVQPQYLIITGKKDISQEVLDLVASKNIKLYNIRQDGALTITVTNKKLSLNTY